MAKSMVIEEALRQAQAALASVSDAPRLDAERLLLFVLHQKEPVWLHTRSDHELSEAEQKEFERAVQERASGKPLAYIVGEWEFYGRPFYVTPDVLIPRPATEELVAAALPYIHPGATVADIGTGSGAIAVTLALETSARVLATDVSAAALKVAKKNAQRYGVESRIEFLQGDMLSPLAHKKIDLIVSNPPYLPAEALAKAGWAVDTVGLSFEPRIALDGGSDGRDFVRKIQATKIPAIVESTGGVIETFNF